MHEATYRIEFKSKWTGSAIVGGEKKQYNPGEKANVDTDTFRALVFTHGIAKAVPVEEIIAEAKKEKQEKPKTQRASRTRASKPKRDKMVRGETNKGE